MKKITLLILFLFTLLTGFAQVGVTTTPIVPTATDAIVLNFDATGTPLEDSEKIYAHIGVTVDGVRWKGVIADWAVNVPKNTFTNLDNNKHQISIGNLHEYFNIEPTSTITEICLVIRNATGTLKSENDDLFIKIHESGLNVQITSPSGTLVFEKGATLSITANASAIAKLDLYINEELITSEAAAETISTNYILSTEGDNTIKVIATTDTQTKEHAITVYVPQPNIEEQRPQNLKHGITKHENGDVSFMLFATNKKGVMLVGDFNDWSFSSDYQMKKDGDYYWLTIPAAQLDPNIEYAYQYAVDFNKRFADPYSEKVLDPELDKWLTDAQYPNLKAYPTDKTTGIASSFIINEEAYIWKTTDFKRPDKSNAVIYELHLRDFTTEGTLNAAYERLDYIKGIGVTAIELMPINEFEGNDSWGYNPSFYFALDKAYGTKNDLKRFIDACHERGIAVLLDVVFNHTFGQSPLVQMYEFSYDDGGKTVDNPYYADKHNFKEPGMRFGLKIDHESVHSQRWIKDVMSYWINEYHIDGYRLDLTKGFTNTEYPVGDYGSAKDQTRIDRLLDYANYVYSNHGEDIIFSCEHLADNSEEKLLADQGLMFWGNLNHNYAEATMGYNTSNKSDLSWGYYKNRSWSNKNLITYMESHDEERLLRKALEYGNASTDGNYTIKDSIIALKRAELSTVFFLSIPGPKLIWQFGELGYDYGINYCPDGTYNGCRVDRKPVKWEYFDNNDPNRRSLYGIYNKLNTLKQLYPDTFNTDAFTASLKNNTKRIQLLDANINSIEGLHVVIIGNFDVTTQSIDPDFPYSGAWYEFFTNEERMVNDNESTTIELQPGEYRLYATQKFLSNPKFEYQSNDQLSVNLYPNPATNQIHFSTSVNKAQIIDLSGKLIATYTDIDNNTINIDQLNQGFYFIAVQDKKGKSTTLKFIKE